VFGPYNSGSNLLQTTNTIAIEVHSFLATPPDSLFDVSFDIIRSGSGACA
jgi:hypothetical protein